MKVVSTLFLSATALISATTLHAGTNNFVVPEFRGTANSEAGYWESFTVAYGAPGNLAQQRPRLWEVHVTVAAAGRSFELATLQWLAPR